MRYITMGTTGLTATAPALGCLPLPGGHSHQQCRPHEYAASPLALQAIYVRRMARADEPHQRLPGVRHLRIPLSVSAGYSTAIEIYAQRLQRILRTSQKRLTLE